MLRTQLRTHHCGELTYLNRDEPVILCGWVQRSRDLGGMTFIDLRDRYGLTQLVFNMDDDPDLCMEARKLGREFVLRIWGIVTKRSSKNPKIPTGDIEILVNRIEILSHSKTPPFTIEDHTDGGEELRMKYRYLDLRRSMVRKNLELRHRIAQETRKYLDGFQFIEVETPVLIKSTPEGARDFIVPSRMNQGEFYALPQSPQTFKQLLMVAGFDRYFQVVKCFRDEDLRADRQPEFTQVDCEMSFVDREDILDMFEGYIRHLFKEVKGIEIPKLQRMQYDDAMRLYGSDKPDVRFDMKFVELKSRDGKINLTSGFGFKLFDESGIVVGICAKGCSEYSRKQIDELTEFVKKPQIGGRGLIYIKYNIDGTIKSSIDKVYSQEQLLVWAKHMNAERGDLMLVLYGEYKHAIKTLKALGELRLEMGNRLGLRNRNEFACLWIIDFPLFEWDENENRYFAMHHPFTAPLEKDLGWVGNDRKRIAKANAYDMVINGVEVGGGSIRIHEKRIQQMMFRELGFSEAEAQAQFGFLMNAFEFGPPPHGGIAFGFDRLCSLFGGSDSIRDFIAFPKNNSGRDVMIDAPSVLDGKQLKELGLK